MAKRKPVPLPEPALLDAPGRCLRCGYSLEGVPEGACPECGLPFFSGVHGVTFCGVARSQGGPAWRRWVWGGLFALAFLYFQLLFFLLMYSPWVALLVFLALAAGVVGMLVTGTARARGAERFFVTNAGLGREVYRRGGGEDDGDGGGDAARSFHPWSGDVAVIRKPLSSVWQRMEIKERVDGGKYTRVVSLGLRCPREALGPLGETIEALSRGEGVGDEAADRIGGG